MNVNAGAAILAMGELSRAENLARDANRAKAAAQHSAFISSIDEALAEQETERITFAAKSQIHGLRSRIEAHVQTEDELIAALKAENPNHPLASREVVDQIFELKRISTPHDPKIIKRTYPDGNLPDGVVPLVNGGPGVVGGEPAYPDPSRAERLALEARQTMMTALNLTEADLDEVDVLSSHVPKLVAEVARIQALVDKDDSAFFSMNRKKRTLLNEEHASVKFNLEQLKLAITKVPERLEAARLAAEEAAKVEAAKIKLAAWMASQQGMAMRG